MMIIVLILFLPLSSLAGWSTAWTNSDYPTLGMVDDLIAALEERRIVCSTNGNYASNECGHVWNPHEYLQITSAVRVVSGIGTNGFIMLNKVRQHPDPWYFNGTSIIGSNCEAVTTSMYAVNQYWQSGGATDIWGNATGSIGHLSCEIISELWTEALRITSNFVDPTIFPSNMIGGPVGLTPSNVFNIISNSVTTYRDAPACYDPADTNVSTLYIQSGSSTVSRTLLVLIGYWDTNYVEQYNELYLKFSASTPQTLSGLSALNRQNGMATWIISGYSNVFTATNVTQILGDLYMDTVQASGSGGSCQSENDAYFEFNLPDTPGQTNLSEVSDVDTIDFEVSFLDASNALHLVTNGVPYISLVWSNTNVRNGYIPGETCADPITTNRLWDLRNYLSVMSCTWHTVTESYDTNDSINSCYENDVTFINGKVEDGCPKDVHGATADGIITNIYDGTAFCGDISDERFGERFSYHGSWDVGVESTRYSGDDLPDPVECNVPYYTNLYDIYPEYCEDSINDSGFVCQEAYAEWISFPPGFEGPSDYTISAWRDGSYKYITGDYVLSLPVTGLNASVDCYLYYQTDPTAWTNSYKSRTFTDVFDCDGGQISYNETTNKIVWEPIAVDTGTVYYIGSVTSAVTIFEATISASGFMLGKADLEDVQEVSNLCEFDVCDSATGVYWFVWWNGIEIELLESTSGYGIEEQVETNDIFETIIVTNYITNVDFICYAETLESNCIYSISTTTHYYVSQYVSNSVVQTGTSVSTNQTPIEDATNCFSTLYYMWSGNFDYASNGAPVEVTINKLAVAINQEYEIKMTWGYWMRAFAIARWEFDYE